MWKIGLTGSIGMGKTTAGRILKQLGIPVHDADGAVHHAFSKDRNTIATIKETFPGVVQNGVVNRPALGKIVFNDDNALTRLENILHPLVRRERERFTAFARQRRLFAIAFDVPLLFETQTDQECDVTIVVTAPAFIQAHRVLRRPGMTMERLEAVRARQMPDWQKRRRADFVVPTNLGRRFTVNRISTIIGLLRHFARGEE